MNQINLSKNINILWFGTPDISAKVLENLILDGYKIVGIVAQQDKPVGRKHEYLPVPTKIIGQKYNIPVYQPEKLRLDHEFIFKTNADLILTLAYGQIVPEDILNFPKFKALNLHGSLLPKYRGASPIQTALLNGDKETGITLMEMVKEMDAGKMFYKSLIKIDDEDNYDSLKEKMVLAAIDAVKNGLEDYLNGTNKGQVQDESLVSFTNKINAEDQRIDFNDSAFNIFNKVRALNSNPGTYFIYKNISYKISKVTVEDISSVPGKIISYDNKGLVIGTNNKSIRILTIQKPGKNMLQIKDFYNGNNKLFEVNKNINEID